jgi:uncharacterized protein YecT (DUF1311 family)
VKIKRLVALQLVGVAFATCVSASQKQKPKSCWDTANTQFELNQCAGSDLDATDKELNKVYQQILKKYADDPVFIAKFKAAQRAWLQFRDAELAAVYPHESEPAYYGSVLPMCHAGEKARITFLRVKELKRWAEGIDEGEVCAGSVKFKDAAEAKSGSHSKK